MNEVLSFFSVIALWMGVGFLAGLIHQRRSGARQQRQTGLAREVAARVAGAQAVFDHIRQVPSGDSRGGALVPRTHALLKRIQERGAFFDEVNALRQQVRQALRGEECEPLAEILHIRRDLWAAGEIILIEDVRSLGPAFADGAAYERMRGEAAGVLFQDRAARPGHEDLIDLRLSLAREEAAQLVADVEEAIRLARENERLPTFSELIAYPVAAARALPGQYRTFRAQFAAFSAHVRAVAVTIRQSETMARGISELRRAREELPRRVATGLEKTSAAARQSAVSLKGHYDFLVQAYDVQAKYEELLRKAPEVTERGKQFIARLELAEKSERLKLTVSDMAKRLAVRGLAHAIAGLQRLQGALEKRLAAAQEGGAEQEAARQPSPASLSAGPAKALKAPDVPAGPAKNAVPVKPKESASPVAKPTAPVRRDSRPGKSDALAARSQPIPAASAAKQANASPPPSVPPVAGEAKPLAARTSALARAAQSKAARTQPPLPKLSMADEKKRPADKDQAVPLALKPNADDAPRQRKGWFGRAPKAKEATPSLSVKAEVKPVSVAVLSAPSSTETSAPKKGGWFRSRRPAVKASAQVGEPPAKASGAAKTGTPSVAVPAVNETTPPGKKRGWFGSRRTKEIEAADNAKPTASPAKTASRGDPSPRAAADVTIPPAASAPTREEAALAKRGGWLVSRRRSKTANEPSRPVVEADAVRQEVPPPPMDMAGKAGTATGEAAKNLPAIEAAASSPSQAKAAASPKASLSAKLTDATSIDPDEEASDNPEETEIVARETEDDDPGPLTRGILESRAAAQPEDKPGRSHSRAFPWLRR